MEYNAVHIHSCKASSLHISQSEILRYMSCKEETEDVKNLIREFLPVVMDALILKGSFIYLPVAASDGVITAGDAKITSASLSANLCGCESAVVFSLTCGVEIDRLIAKYSRTRPSAALCINAIATAAIECYADEFCCEMENNFAKDGLHIGQRFSPGYGDLSLEYQPLFLKLTNATRLCAISLTASCMMIPSKSITAIMGVSKSEGCIADKCLECGKQNCEFSKLKFRKDL